MGFTLDQKAIQYISYFENISGASIEDCLIMDDNKIVFIVKKGQAGLAIGKRGTNIKRAIRDLKKEIEIIESGETPEELIRNSLAPAEIKEITISKKNDGKEIAIVQVDQKHRGLAIGKGGSKIERCRKLAQRHFQIDEVILTKA
ncbi:MAG: NusA-like transcription termination signal-binding factor [Promethearchaeota archaeon]